MADRGCLRVEAVRPPSGEIDSRSIALRDLWWNANAYRVSVLGRWGILVRVDSCNPKRPLHMACLALSGFFQLTPRVASLDLSIVGGNSN